MFGLVVQLALHFLPARVIDAVTGSCADHRLPINPGLRTSGFLGLVRCPFRSHRVELGTESIYLIAGCVQRGGDGAILLCQLLGYVVLMEGVAAGGDHEGRKPHNDGP